jgi:perosamine synthetase
MTNAFLTPAGEIPWWRTNLGPAERAGALAAIDAEHFSHGPETQALERELAATLEVPHVLVTPSGTAALMLSLIALGVRPGDRVIVPTRNFIAAAHAAWLLGAKVDLVDCRPDRPVVNAEQVIERITDQTRAIIVVHLAGRGVDVEAIRKVADKRGISVVEDACQGLFSRRPNGRHLGTLGSTGCFSFGMAKIVSTGIGGAVATHDSVIKDKLMMARNHGVADIISHQYLVPGFNFRFSDVLSGIGLAQFARRAEKEAHCLAIYRRYAEGLAGLPFISIVPVDIDQGEVPQWVEVMSPMRDRIMQYLADKSVQTRRFVPCLHSAPHLATGESFPNSERFSAQGFVLPSGPSQPLENVDRVIELLAAYPER